MKNKFRFWCKETSENKNFSKEGWWTYPNFLLSKYYSNFDIFDCPHFVACQSTGLVDKNGKEVYEGDILKTGNTFYVEIFWNKNGGFNSRKIKSNGECKHTEAGCVKHWEIVGNIFENKDLL